MILVYQDHSLGLWNHGWVCQGGGFLTKRISNDLAAWLGVVFPFCFYLVFSFLSISFQSVKRVWQSKVSEWR